MIPETHLIGTVIAVCRNADPGLPKPVVDSIHLLTDLGVEGDYHAGKLVRHRYLAKKYPTRRNLRQVLIVDAAAFRELAQQDIHIGPGMMGENITIEGLAVMQLPEGTHLQVGTALVEITEVRKPCAQLNGIDEHLLSAVVTRVGRKKVFKSGIMARVLQEGLVRAGDTIQIVSAEAISHGETHCK